jgi:uncharacterized protein (TIGR02145 family)
MKSTLLTTLAFALSLSAFSQVKDVDGNEYKTIKIREQEWMAENLNVSHFRNGDEIPQAKTTEEWKKAGEEGKPAWCYYDYNSENGIKHGKLYNIHAINDARGLTPEGWELSSSSDWQNLLSGILKKYKGSNRSFTGAKILSSTSGWNTKNGKDNYGFNTLPGGWISGEIPSFNGMGRGALFYGGKMFEDRQQCDIIMIETDINAVNLFQSQSNQGFSVRCIKSN